MYTIVFIDIVGSTQLYEAIGDDRAKEVVIATQNDIARLVTEGGGEVVEIVGDEVMSRFDDVNAAVLCVCSIQGKMESLGKHEGRSVAVRIGMHTGPAIIEGGRMFGDSVNVAARMASLAKARQIVTTEAVVNLLPTALSNLARRFDEVRVKGKQEPLVIYDLVWRRDALTSLIHRGAAPRHTSSLLRLRHGDRTFVIEAQGAGFSTGRDPSNSLVVVAPTVSRHHAKIEFSRGKFVLVDTSTNGTYVRTHDGQALYLRRETLPLWGRGRIGLGAPAGEDESHVVHYEWEPPSG